MATGPSVHYEFGPFRVDPDKQLLLRDNQPVAVTPKAFETLLILVRHSREVVSKDDLMKALWPDAFVEEGNLSQNIFMLRRALGDTPEDRRYIVTVPGRGYRLAAPVRAVMPDIENAARDVPASLNRTVSWKYLLPVGAALGLLILGTAFFPGRRQPGALGEQDSVLIADFTNTTGDSVFDGTLRQGLAVQLEQSPFLSLVSEERIRRALRLMGRPADARLTPDLARDICERTASAAVLDGSIASLGSQYVLGLRAQNCRTGDVIDDEQVQAARKEDVLNALSRVASNFRTRVGESLATVKRHDTPLAEATTPSLEALKAYSMGWKVGASSGDDAAVPFFKRAVEIDPQFAVAHAALGLAYGASGESAAAAESTGKAYELRDRTSDNERFFITAYYDGRVTGNQEKAQQTCEAWAQAYPREVMPHAFLSGFIYPASGKYEKASEEARKAVELDPDSNIGYLHLGYNSVYLGRPGEAENVLRRAAGRHLDVPYFFVLRYDLAFLKGDDAGMKREVAAAQGQSSAEDWIADRQAFVLASTGHLREARRMSRRAADLAQQAAHRERAALFEIRAALREALSGNAPAARRSAAAALELAKDREVEYGAAFALALSGDSSRSQILANDLERNFPDDTSVRFSYLPALRALLALNHGEPSKAIDLLEAAAPYELGEPRSGIQGSFGALYPVYVRGEAYLAAHRGAEAAAEFRKMVDHRGIMIGDAISAFAHLELARAYAIAGDTARARSQYQDFFALWRDADPDIPILEPARAEYTRLQ